MNYTELEQFKMELTKRFNYPKKKYQDNFGHGYHRSVNNRDDVERAFTYLEGRLNYYENRDFNLHSDDIKNLRDILVKCQIAINKVVTCHNNPHCDFSSYNRNEIVSAFELIESQDSRIQELNFIKMCQD